jgi:hypothetical protein
VSNRRIEGVRNARTISEDTDTAAHRTPEKTRHILRRVPILRTSGHCLQKLGNAFHEKVDKRPSGHRAIAQGPGHAIGTVQGISDLKAAQK